MLNTFAQNDDIISKGRIESGEVVLDSSDFTVLNDAYETGKKLSYTEGYNVGLQQIVQQPFDLDETYSFSHVVDTNTDWRSFSHDFSITVHPHNVAIVMMYCSRNQHQYSVTSDNPDIQVDHLQDNTRIYLGVLRNLSDEEQAANIHMVNAVYAGGAGRDTLDYYIYTYK